MGMSYNDVIGIMGHPREIDSVRGTRIIWYEYGPEIDLTDEDKANDSIEWKGRVRFDRPPLGSAGLDQFGNPTISPMEVEGVDVPPALK